jgi:predicted AAA+ superfamily ATPase
MNMDPWYRVATPRKEVREGRSFNPDEFAIALEQVVAGKAPEDYRDPEKFFLRTCFTRALKDHAGMVLQRLQAKLKTPLRCLLSLHNLVEAKRIL